MAGRDQPRDLENAPDWSRDPQQIFARGPHGEGDKKASPDEKFEDEEMIDALTPDDARRLGRECYQSSTNWLNQGRRLKWNESLRAFQSMHGVDSKYASNDYRYRSRLFRPKTRSMVRKSEAKAAQAFFANQDIVNISPTNDDDPMQLASAEVNQALLQYRLTYTIPWFLTLMGARQDAEVMGICVAKAYWKYKEKYTHTERRHKTHPVGGAPLFDDTGKPLTEDFDIYDRLEDHPWIDLVAPENIRFDPGSDWRNPIATSPYLIELIPMRVIEVREKIDNGDWLNVSDGSLRNANDLDDDVTRRAREQGRVPGKDNDSFKPKPYDICWVRENILRRNGREWHFFSVGGGGELLTKPRPLEEVYLHGIRPYVCGTVVPEAHKTYPTSKVELVKDLQRQTNDIVNLRLDNVKLALNPRQIAKTGRNLDPSDLRTFMPGKVLMTVDPEGDIKWDRPPDVTASAYQEQEQIDQDFDGLTGSQNNATIAQQRPAGMDTLGGMELMSNDASEVAEYEQRVFAETFVEPIMRQLILLEQAYESDPVVLTLAGKQAKLWQKFGISEITDKLLQQQLTTKVNVGVGATNPALKLKNFVQAGEIIGQLYGPAAAMASNPQEVIKEVYGLCGYKDGERFFMPGVDIHQIMQQMAQQGGKGKGDGAQDGQAKVQVANINAQSRLKETQLKTQSDMNIANIDFRKEQMSEQAEDHRAVFNAQRELETMPMQHHLDMQAKHADHAHAQQTNQQDFLKQAMGGRDFGAQHSQQHAAPKSKKSGSQFLHYDHQGRRVSHPGASAA